jgi:hypothetical protein
MDLVVRFALVVISRFDIDFLVKDVVTIFVVLPYDAIFDVLSFIIILEDHSHKSKASSSPSCLVSHNDDITHLTILREVREEIVF